MDDQLVAKIVITNLVIIGAVAGFMLLKAVWFK